MSYHCSIYAIESVESRQDKVNFKPFTSASEMTKFTGLSVEAWQQRQVAAKRRKKNRVSKNQFLNDLAKDLAAVIATAKQQQ